MAVRQQTITQKAVSFISKNANIHTNTQQPTRLEQWLGVKIKRRMDSVETSESTTKKLKTNDEPIDLMSSQTEFELIKQNGFFFNYECPAFNWTDMKPSATHTLMFDHTSLRFQDHKGPPLPLPANAYVDMWNDNFVKMPFSAQNVNEADKPMWKDIVQSLKGLADVLITQPDSIHIEYAIKKYNKNYRNYWNFNSLHYFFNHELESSRAEHILKNLVPRMIRLALELPKKICAPIGIMREGVSHTISLSQEQCACILANAFFCTFPERYENVDAGARLPFINFNNLFGRSKSDYRLVKIEKLKCIFHYFERVTTTMPEGVVTFSRQCLKDEEMIDFKNSSTLFRNAIINQNGTIEDCVGAVQLDFANKYLGGGVLNSGCVQEEIRFLICPELIVSMLFTECLSPSETVLIRGCERFSSYTGYAETFQWSDDYIDQVARDENQRIYTDVLALDALSFRYPKMQFEEAKLTRELRKCLSAFRVANEGKASREEQVKPAIATGNWGCGAFRGDRQLKFLIQLMVASECGRDLVYFTFNDRRTSESLTYLLSCVMEKKLTVGQVYALIGEYARVVKDFKADKLSNFLLSDFFRDKFANE